jgi:NADPH2:quinone reductase
MNDPPRAIRVHEHGGPDVLRWEPVSLGTPGPGEALVRQTAVGLNFLDVYHRTGLYKVPSLPFTPGSEGAGVVEAVGPGVTEVGAGDRVAYAGELGAYAERRIVRAARLVPLPASIDDRAAAAMMLKGMTAQYLLRRIVRPSPGDAIVVHAAAGGVGLLVCQWARHLGVTVIGTVSSDAKAEIAARHGCDHPIVTAREDFVARTREITGGRGALAVLDSIGKDTFLRSLECLRPLGTLVSFGQSSGSVPPFDVSLLAQKGSLFLTRPTLFTYTASRDDLLASANDLFAVVASGAVAITVGQTYALADAAAAHRDLEARRTTGSTLLLP